MVSGSMFPLASIISLDGHEQTVLVVVSVLFLLLAAANQAVAIWSRTRKSPPDHDVYATKLEARSIEARLDGKITAMERRLEKALDESFGGLNTRVETWQVNVNRELQSISHAIGRLEGALSKLRE